MYRLVRVVRWAESFPSDLQQRFVNASCGVVRVIVDAVPDDSVDRELLLENRRFVRVSWSCRGVVDASGRSNSSSPTLLPGLGGWVSCVEVLLLSRNFADGVRARPDRRVV